MCRVEVMGGLMMFCSMLGFISSFLHNHPNNINSYRFGDYLDSTRLFRYCSNLEAKKTSAAVSGPITPEFSRTLNVAQIPKKKPVLCRLLANEQERANLAIRFDLQNLAYFAANVTLARIDELSIEVTGKLEAHIKSGLPSVDEDDPIEADIVKAEFDTMILNAVETGKDLTLEDAPDYDDEVAANGDIDVGEIASQYLALELF